MRTMTLDGLDEIASAWAPIVRAHGYSINLRSVFCHSRPRVTFVEITHPKYPGGKKPRCCELADLLIVMDHIDCARRIDDRRAVLIQAKMLKGGAVKPTGKEWVQHELTQTTGSWFKSPISLANYLGAMAVGDPSCSREAVRDGLDDRSFTVDELLRVAAARPINKKNIVARGNNNVVGFISDTSSPMLAAGEGGGSDDFFNSDASEWPEVRSVPFI